MKFRVKIYNEEKEIISDDIWFGNSIDNVKFWVDLAIRDIIKKLNYKHLYYEIDNVDEPMSEDDIKRQREVEEQLSKMRNTEENGEQKKGFMNKLFSMFGRK